MFESVKIAEGAEVEAVVVGLFEDKELMAEAQFQDDTAVRAALARRECTGEKENLVETFRREGERETRILLLGLGKREELKASDLRKLAAVVGRRLAQTQTETVAIELAAALGETALDSETGG